MKKVLFAVVMVMGMLNISGAATYQVAPGDGAPEAQCKYTVVDARAGLKKFVQAGFVPREQSPDGNFQLGAMFFHDPASKVADSVEAMTLIIVDKREPDKELLLMVVYIGPKQSVLYKRELKQKGTGKALGPCFEKSVEDNPEK